MKIFKVAHYPDLREEWKYEDAGRRLDEVAAQVYARMLSALPDDDIVKLQGKDILDCL